jgi:MFS superfamily sulfate permease-like transporter
MSSTKAPGWQGLRFDLGEISGAVADLGVMLPLVLALITLNGVNASSAFVVIALAYFLNAFAYHLPVPVQPLKALAAAALALGLTPGVITASAWWMAAIFLLLAVSGAVSWVSKFFPQPVVRGIQIGLGLLLLKSAWTLLSVPSVGWDGYLHLGGAHIPWLWMAGLLALVALVVGLLWRPSWAGLLVVLGGLCLGLVRFGLPDIEFAFTLPSLVIPSLPDFGPAFVLLVLPQVPLSLANSVFATSDAARQYFGPDGERASPLRLLLTMGTANVAAAALGGVPVCHGSGGLTAHYRLGARTGGALLIIGTLFLALGLLGGSGLLSLLQLIPFPALGVLLIYVGAQHMLLAKDLRGVRDWAVALLVAALAWLTQNLAVGFLGGLSLNAAWSLYERIRLAANGRRPRANS